MRQETIHDLAAAFALDALDDQERQEFEAHLDDCDDCRTEVASLRDTAASIAYAAEGPAPPPALRDRVLDSVREERASNVVPLRRRRWALPAVAAVAALAAGTAIGLGVWAASLSGSLDRATTAKSESVRAALILASPDATRVPIGEKGQVAVLPDGRAALASPELGRAPAGKTYEAWVVGVDGPEPAGLFKGADGGSLVVLRQPVPKGARVAVSLEPARGSPKPTEILSLSSEV